MKNSVIIFFAILLLALVTRIFFTFEKNSEEVTIRLLQTTDVHGHYIRQKKKDFGGWLRIASLIKQARKEVSNNLLVDCGDTIQGSAMAVFERGEIAIDLLNELKYDAWILGNHELDFGLSHLEKLINKTKAPVISGNFSFRNKKFPAWKIYDREGVKIAIIGLQVAYLRHWFIGKDYENFYEEKGYAIVKRSLDELYPLKPDIIIVAAHQGCGYDWRGVNEIDKICQDFPEISIVLGGHTHRNIPGKKINKSYYMQAGEHAKHLGVLDIVYDKTNKKINSISSHLREAATIPYEKTTYNKLSNQLKSLRKKIDTPFINLAKRITSKAMSKVVSQAATQATKSSFSLQRRIRYGLAKGDINFRQFFRLFPYENRLFSFLVSYQDLKTIYEEQKKTKSGRGQELWLEKKKVKKIAYFKDKKRIVVNSYTAAGAGRYPKLVKIINKNRDNLKEHPFVLRDVVKNYLITLNSKK